jgi:hypothetical protein
VPCQKVRSALSHPVARGGLDRRLDDARVVREAEVIVAAEREEFPAVDRDARALRALPRKAYASKTGTADLGEALCESLQDHGRWAARAALSRGT